MTTLTKLPHTVTQTGDKNCNFQNLYALTNTTSGSYAMTKEIHGKNQSHNRPPQVNATNYQFNIPSNAVVKRISVHIPHSKYGSKNGSWYLYANTCCNIPAPTITLLGLGLSKKGQAPIQVTANQKSATHIRLDFDGTWDASVVNNPNFGVNINYEANRNKSHGHIRINYVQVTIQYFVPDFNTSVMAPREVYNKNEYDLSCILSDSNTTGRSTDVTINVPQGFTYTGFKGNGTVERVQNRVLRWRPSMTAGAYSPNGLSAPNAVRVNLKFSVDVAFSGDSSSVDAVFTSSLPVNGRLFNHTVTVRKELPVTTEEESSTPSVDEDTETSIEWQDVTIGEAVPINFITDDTSRPNRIVHILPVDANHNVELLSENTSAKLIEDRGDGSRNTMACDQYINSKHRGYNYTDGFTYSCIFEEIGLYAILLYSTTNAYPTTDYEDSIEEQSQGQGEFYKTAYFKVRPQESSLTTPFMSLLTLTDEELDRLGDGYSYILQSTMKQTTEELYTRNWYRNFRVGVFNNRIEANCSTYYEYNNTNTEFQGYIKVTKLDITEGYITVTSDNPILLTVEETEYNITTTPTNIPLLNEYTLPVTYTKTNDDNCILTIKQYNSNDELLDTLEYHINFNSEETTELEEKIRDTTDYTTLTNEQIFQNAEYWSSTQAGLNTSNSVECLFTYDKTLPLYLIVTGDYPEGSPGSNPVTFTEPCIIEETDYKERKPNGTYPTPIETLISNDNDSAELTLPEFTKSDTIVFYELPLDENYGTDTTQAIRGIEVKGTIEQADTQVIYCRLKSPTGESRQRSIVINDYNDRTDSVNEFVIGGMGDLWGFSTLDIINLEDWEVEIFISNTAEETISNINFGNIQIGLYIEPVTNQTLKVYINGEDLAYYNAFITNVEVPEGLETDTDYLSVDGTDTNDAYRQNIKEKTITIEFEIGESCNLSDNTLSLRELTKLLVNDRDEYNRPIPKRLELNFYPDVYWEYIMEEPLDNEIDINTYTCKAKLTIPAGTSYDKQSTTTANMGYINGLASINPVIIVKPSNEILTITEENTNQKFSIGYSGGWNDKILEIDCENRIAWLKTNEEDTEPINLNKYVDFNSQWFSIKGEYNFTSTGGTVMTVDYQERWS